ncbi:hypothetical protein EVAR_26828_1 [Eumeta japonica]|uniref:Mos1 transposase HTH domain-containing protein n=1 Tax=Eumeta variegata TaxID=151549 RepID=A0A4C1VYZ0_EUMVA|nr:hypothetical protein EVAR_26828_1 [Eumeta japonica]
MTESNVEIRYSLEFYYVKGKNSMQAAKKICNVYRPNAVPARVAQNSFKRFQSGNFDVKGSPTVEIGCEGRYLRGEVGEDRKEAWYRGGKKGEVYIQYVTKLFRDRTNRRLVAVPSRCAEQRSFFAAFADGSVGNSPPHNDVKQIAVSTQTPLAEVARKAVVARRGLPLPAFSPRTVLMYSAAVGGEGAVALQVREAAPGELGPHDHDLLADLLHAAADITTGFSNEGKLSVDQTGLSSRRRSRSSRFPGSVARDRLRHLCITFPLAVFSLYY